MRSPIATRTLFVLTLMAIGLTAPPAPAQQIPPIVILPVVPGDIPGGAPNADLTAAAAFAWQEFIALSWPAAAGAREMPDLGQPFGQNGTSGGSPLVWQTMRHKIEIFPSREMSDVTVPLPGPHGASAGPPSFGYDLPPAYYYVPSQVGTSDGSVQACPGQTPAVIPPWVNLDEITQIGLDQMFAGVLPATAPPGAHNTAPQQIRFMAKANRIEYVYTNANFYWYHSPLLALAEQNFQNAVATGTPPQSPYVLFPVGTIEVKSAWRPLGSQDNPARFHTTTVRFYETSNGLPCYFDEQWALLALHIIHKTQTAPAFVFATFEQADNIQTFDGKPFEDAEGRIIQPLPGSPTQPPLIYQDSPTNPVVKLFPGSKYCSTAEIGSRLFFHEIATNTALPAGGDICVLRRFHDIPQAIIDVNAAAHQAIAAYNTANNVSNSPWQYYKLVNVQAYPFDKTQVDPSKPNGTHGPASYYQANGVVETDYTLQNFHGRLSNGAPTDYKSGEPGHDFKNLHLFTQFPPSLHAYNMGGCQGCHANAQLGGTDFSFILDGNGFQPAPDTPDPNTALAAAARYRQRFLRLR